MAHELTPQIIADLEVPRNVYVSKDGKLIAYTTQTMTRKERGLPKTSLWLAEVTKFNSSERLTPGTYFDESPAFSPDRHSLAFTSNRENAENNRDLYLIALDESKHITKLTDSFKHGKVEAFKWTPDGSTIIFHSRPKPDSNLDVKVYGESILYRNLWTLNLASKKIAHLIQEEADVVQFDCSPDGTQVIYTTQAEPTLDSGEYGFQVKVVDLSTKASRLIVTTSSRLTSLCWSEEGILAVASYAHGGVNHATSLYLIDSEGMHPRGYGQESCAKLVKSCYGKALIYVQDNAEDQLHTLDGNVLFSARETVSTYCASFCEGNITLAVIKDQFGVPPEVYSVVNSNVCQLSTHGQKVAEIDIGNVQFFQYKRGDVPMDGYYCVASSLQNDFGKIPLPTVVLPHGGPYARCTDGFDASGSANLGAYLTSCGYLVLVPNYRGGSSHGDRYASAVIGHADISYDDVIWIVKKGIEEDKIDKDRVAITGWSQGGYITYLAVTRDSTLHFAAAAAGAGVSDLYLDTCLTDLTSFMSSLTGYCPWDDHVPSEKELRASPVHHVKDVKTPLLIIHGEEDERVPVRNALLFAKAMKVNGKEFEMALYPRFGHGEWPMIWERGHFIDMVGRVENFFARHLKVSN